MVVTTVVAVCIGICLCLVIVAAAAQRLRLPVREALIWFGLVELEVPALTRATERRRRR